MRAAGGPSLLIFDLSHFAAYRFVGGKAENRKARRTKWTGRQVYFFRISNIASCDAIDFHCQRKARWPEGDRRAFFVDRTARP